MNIAMLTTWNSACGIAEYSRHLVDEWSSMGHNILLLTNKPEPGLYAHPRMVVTPVFGVHWWGEDSTFKCFEAQQAWRVFEDKFGKIDVLYIQYQSSLYQEFGFNEFLRWANSCPVVLVKHDSSWNPQHKIVTNKIIVHNKELNHNYFIPFPTIERTPSVFSFGMGRNDYAFIERACTELGILFWSHDSRKDGWWSEEKLFEAMKEADAIILWYNDVNIKGQSAALRTAISSHRPVIVNDIGWFADAPDFVHKINTTVPKFKDGTEWKNYPSPKTLLQVELEDVLHLDYIKENSYKNCAKKYLEVINGITKNK